jgi:hypothetical protein
MMQDYYSDEEGGEEHSHNSKSESPLSDVEDYQNTLAVPELSHSSGSPSLLQPQEKHSDNVKGWLSTLDIDDFTDIVPSVSRNEHDETDGETFDGIEMEEEEVAKQNGVAGCDSASISSDGAVVPCYNAKYGCSVRKTKSSRRTLEKLIAGFGDEPVMVTDDDSDDDDDNSTRPPTVEAAFEDLWEEEASHIASVMKDSASGDRIRDALSVDSDDEIGVYEDTASVTTSDHGRPEESISTNNSKQNEALRNNSVLGTAARLFGGISSAGEDRGHPRKNRSNKDEASTSSSAKEKVVAAVSTLQKQVSKKLVVAGESVSPAVSSLQKSVSRGLTVVSGNVTKGILSRNKSGNSAAETSATTPTTTNPESMTEYPDLEAQEDIIEEEDDDDIAGDATVSSASMKSKEEMTPRTLLWVLIFILIVVIVIIFVAMLSVFAKQA